MRNISIKQILVLLIISFFLFGDFLNVKKKLHETFKKANNFFFKNNRKKGT